MIWPVKYSFKHPYPQWFRVLFVIRRVVLLLLIYCLLLLPLFAGICVLSLFCYAILSVRLSFAIISLRIRESWLLHHNCHPVVMLLLVLCASSVWYPWLAWSDPESFVQRGSNFYYVFLEDPNTTISGQSSARQRNVGGGPMVAQH